MCAQLKGQDKFPDKVYCIVSYHIVSRCMMMLKPRSPDVASQCARIDLQHFPIAYIQRNEGQMVPGTWRVSVLMVLEECLEFLGPLTTKMVPLSRCQQPAASGGTEDGKIASAVRFPFMLRHRFFLDGARWWSIHRWQSVNAALHGWRRRLRRSVALVGILGLSIT